MGQVPPPPPLTREDYERKLATLPTRQLRAAVRRARTPRLKRFAAHVSMVIWPNNWAMKILGPLDEWNL